MPAITFNGAKAIAYGTTNLARVYAGATLVWSRNVGLPYTHALATVPSGWTLLHGTWTPKMVGAENGIAGGGAGGAISTHNTISAYNVRISVQFNTATGGSSVGLMARDTPLGGYYQCEYHLGKLSISRTGVALGSWAIPGAPITGTMELSCIGTTITAKIGAVSHSVTDTLIHEPGTVGIAAATGGWIRNLSVTAA